MAAQTLIGIKREGILPNIVSDIQPYTETETINLLKRNRRKSLWLIPHLFLIIILWPNKIVNFINHISILDLLLVQSERGYFLTLP